MTELARSRLSRRFAARLDAEDIVMSAYRSFFVGLRERDFAISHDTELWQLLVQITLRKVYRQAARHTASKRAVARDMSLFLSDGSVLAIPGREPLPDEAAAIAEEVEQLLKPLPESARRIVELRLQGEAIDAIARDLRINERTVRRWLDRVKRHLLERRRESREGRTPIESAPRAETNGLASLKPVVRRTSRRPMIALPKSLPVLKYADFVLQKMIAAGTSGKVYCALSRNDGCKYALKFLRKSFLVDRAAVERFLGESALIAGFKHPNIAAVLGWGCTPQGGYFFAMELSESDLQRKINDGRVSIAHAVEWIIQAGRGVEYAHGRSIIHCDLKPSNLLLNHDGRVLVADFGLAIQKADRIAKLRFAGTPAFMAPEQIIAPFDDISVHTDVYGLGGALYALLAGRPPFIGARASDVLTQIISTARPPSVRAFRPRTPAHVERACMKCLEK
ncbi:MAG TPA: protein kinase, partial [Pirellulales bacterium]|nr:protein kinase [Pirellulales bacterium]